MSQRNRAPSHNSVASDDNDLDQEQLTRFNRDLIRDNERMLEEIDDLRDENDSLREGLDRIKKEYTIQRRYIAELESAREGQSEAWLLLQQEVEREEEVTNQLHTVFQTLSSARFDNLFIRMASDRHEALGGTRGLTKSENKDVARTAFAESSRQLDNVQGIVESMVSIPNFHSNPKDALVLEAIGQIISLSRVMNQTVVAKFADRQTPTPAPAPAPPRRNRSPFRRFFSSLRRKKATTTSENGSVKRTDSNASAASAASGASALDTKATFDLCDGVTDTHGKDDIEELVKGLITARRPAGTTTSQVARTESATDSTRNSGRCNPSLTPHPTHPTHPHNVYHVDDSVIPLPHDRRELPLTARGVASRAELLHSLSEAFKTPGDQTARRMEQQLAATQNLPKSRGSMNGASSTTDPNAQTYS